MAVSWTLIAVVVAIVVGTTFVAYCFRGKKVELWLPMGLALGSLVISIFGTFKHELFIFDPEIRMGDFYIVNGTKNEEPTPAFILPMQFLNRGYGEGVIEDLIIRVSKDGDSFFMVPTQNLSWMEFVRAKGEITMAVVQDAFIGFPLGSKEALSKTILFNKRGKRLRIEAGDYEIEIFALTSRANTPQLMFRFSVLIDDDKAEDISRGKSIGILHRRIKESEMPEKR